MKVTDTRKPGYDALIKALSDQALHQIQVGIDAEDGSFTYPNGMTLSEVASIHEFGLNPRIPQRSFVREWFDENTAACRLRLREEMLKVVMGRQSYEKALQVFAGWAARGMRDRIDTRAALTPNAPRTIAEKGFDYPLVEDGHLRHAIKGKVDK